MNNIREKALELEEKYRASYEEYCKENPGYIMHGDSSKADAMHKASFAESLEDLKAMHRCYQIQYNSMQGKPSGFKFYTEAILELIQIIENE